MKSSFIEIIDVDCKTGTCLVSSLAALLKLGAYLSSACRCTPYLADALPAGSLQASPRITRMMTSSVRSLFPTMHEL